jgi:hypothetical protein
VDYISEASNNGLNVRTPASDAFPAYPPADIATPPKPPEGEVVVIVHGTFASPTSNPYVHGTFPYREPRWWESYGSFGKALDQALARHGSGARCNMLAWRLGDKKHWLGWSGGNSEVERRQGAYELAKYLRSLQASDEIHMIHIVAHSHGGNVVRRAFRYMNHPSYKLGRVIYLGTPFLHFNDRAVWRRLVGHVHWPMIMALAGIIAATPLLWADETFYNFTAMYVVVGLLYFTLVSLWRYARSTEGSTGEVPAVAVHFEHDEAIGLLRACAAFTARPHVGLRDVLGGTVQPRERPDDSFSLVADALIGLGVVMRVTYRTWTCLSDMWNRPVCRAAERATTWSYQVPLLGLLAGSVLALLLIMLFRPYRPPVQPFFTSRLPQLRKLFYYSHDEEVRQRTIDGKDSGKDILETTYLAGFPVLPIYRIANLRSLASFIPVLVYWFIFYPLDKFAGLLPWFGAVARRFFILLGARATAGAVAGIDILGGAFDGPRTGEVPQGVEDIKIPAAIEKDLEERLDASMRVNLAPLRDALDPARNAMLFHAVKTAFSDPALLHAQYYQDERVVDYIAELVAGTRKAQLD